MWPFRRRRDTDAEGLSSSGAEGTSTVAPSAPAPRGPEAWRTMAPLQRTFGEAPRTYRTDDIGEILTSWNSPRLSGELGHQVSADAPAGILHGMATTVEAAPVSSLPASSETATLRELPRHHDHDTPSSDAPGAGAAPASGAESTGPPAGEPAAPTEHAPSADATVAGLASPLRTLSASAAPVPTVSRVVAPPDVVAPRTLPSLPLQRATEPGGAPSATPGHTPQSAAEPSATPAPGPSEAPPSDAAGSHADTGVASPAAPSSPAPDASAGAPLPPPIPLVVAPPERTDGPAGPSLPPGAVLGPPIQPRSIQRRTAELPLPPVQRQVDAATTTRAGPSSATDATPPAGAASDADAGADHPGAAAPLTGHTTPLVQRSAEPGHDHDHSGGDGEGDGAGLEATGDGDEELPGAPAMPLQRQHGAPPDRAGSDSAVARPIGLGPPLVDLPETSPPEAAPPAAVEAGPGLGAAIAPGLPLAGLPTVQRSASEGPPARAEGAAATDANPSPPQATAPTPATEQDAGTINGPPPPADPVAALLGDRLPPASNDDPATPDVEEPGVPDSGDAGPPALPLAGPVPPAAPVTVSTLQGTPLVLQRSLDEGPPTILGGNVAAPPSPVPATRAPTPAAPGTLRAASAGPVVQRTTLSTSSMPGRPATSVLPGLPPQSLQPRSLTLASPAPAPAVPTSWTDAGDLAVANGVAQRMLDGSVQFNVPPSVGAAARSWPPSSNATSDHSSQQPAIRGSATSAPEAPPKEGNEREELEDQARKLWPLLRRKLTNELLTGPKGRQARW